MNEVNEVDKAIESAVRKLFEDTFNKAIIERNQAIKNEIISAAFNLYSGELGLNNPTHPDIIKLGEALYPIREARRIAKEKGLDKEDQVE